MIYGAGGLGGLAGWRLLQRTAAAQTERLSRDVTVNREQAAFADRMARNPTAKELVGDYQGLKVALTAFGLEADLPNKAFLQKILESDLSDPKSLANRLSDKRYRQFAQAFAFAEPVRPSPQQIISRVSSLFLDREFERRVGESSPDMRMALYAKRELATLAQRPTASENTKWFEILANAPLAKVVKGALGMPDSLSRAPIDTQLATMTRAAANRFGLRGPSDLSDPAKLNRLIDSFLAQASINSTQATPYSPALVILSG